MSALAVLLANDFWLKRAWPGVVSGKLSDFAGIAVVSLLLLTALPQRRRLVVGVIVVGFAWWKSPLSQPVIDALNAWLPLPLHRTVDDTDLVAFVVMPACAVVASRAGDFALPSASLRRCLAPPAIALTAFALMATSTMPIQQNYMVRRADGAPELDRDAVARTIAQVAALDGFEPDPRSGQAFFSGSISLRYAFVGTRTVSFEVYGFPHGGPFSTSEQDKAARLRNDLKARLAADFKDLEYIEPLGPRPWPRPASSPASGP